MEQILTAILDATLPMPLNIKMPKDSKILCVRYHHQRDHIYFVGNPHTETEIRKFIYGKSGQYFEHVEGVDYVYVDSTVDEDGDVWHYFEMVRQTIPYIPLQTHTRSKKK